MPCLRKELLTIPVVEFGGGRGGDVEVLQTPSITLFLIISDVF